MYLALQGCWMDAVSFHHYTACVVSTIIPLLLHVIGEKVEAKRSKMNCLRP